MVTIEENTERRQSAIRNNEVYTAASFFEFLIPEITGRKEGLTEWRCGSAGRSALTCAPVRANKSYACCFEDYKILMQRIFSF